MSWSTPTAATEVQILVDELRDLKQVNRIIWNDYDVLRSIVRQLVDTQAIAVVDETGRDFSDGATEIMLSEIQGDVLDKVLRETP